MNIKKRKLKKQEDKHPPIKKKHEKKRKKNNKTYKQKQGKKLHILVGFTYYLNLQMNARVRPSKQIKVSLQYITSILTLTYFFSSVVHILVPS